MYVRCAGCGAATRVDLGAIELGVTCVSCARHTSLDGAGKLGATPAERYQKALDFSKEHRIDLASAYSVLLGIFPLEKALAIPPDDSYDPGFRDAVAEGYLNVQQAVERGDRVLYASTLALRHGLPMRLAFLVADNRMRLSQALKQKSAAAAAQAGAPAAEGSPRSAWTLATLTLLAAVAGALAIWGTQRTPVGDAKPGTTGARTLRDVAEAGKPQGVRPWTETFRDSADRLTGVTGPDPRKVLDKYCELAPKTSPREFVKLVPSGGDKVGVFRQDGTLLAIDIRKDPVTESWVAGNGLSPIEPKKAPE
jgi:hypothetical protein